jgi:hypothetical protein
MSINRREFLCASTGAIAAASTLPSRLALAGTTLDIRVVGFAGGLTRNKFTALLNETFYLRDEKSGTSFVTLIEVRGLEQPTNPDNFSLFFRGPALPRLPAGTYTLEHYLAGITPIYLEPALAPGQLPLYRADFCLLN